MTLRGRITRLERASGARRGPTVLEMSDAIFERALDLFLPELVGSMDPRDVEHLADLPEDGEASPRWHQTFRRVIEGHDAEGRPLALPHAAFVAMRDNPAARLGMMDCEDCGLLIPEAGGPEAALPRPLLPQCPLCGGQVGREAYLRAHGGLPCGWRVGQAWDWWDRSKAAAQLKSEGGPVSVFLR